MDTSPLPLSARIKWFKILTILIIICSLITFRLLIQKNPYKELLTSKQKISYSPNSLFLSELRKTLTILDPTPNDLSKLKNAFLKSNFPKNLYGFSISLHQSNLNHLRSVQIHNRSSADILKAITTLQKKAQFHKFDISDTNQCHIRLNFIITKPVPLKLSQLSDANASLSDGYDGLWIRNNKNYYIFPGDTLTGPYTSTLELINQFNKEWPTEQWEEFKYMYFRVVSYISLEDGWVKM